MAAEREDILRVVRRAESDSEKKIAEAKRRADEIIKKGIIESSGIIRRAEKEGESIYNTILEEKVSQLEEMKKGMRSSAEDDVRKMKADVESRIPRAIDLLLTKLDSWG